MAKLVFKNGTEISVIEESVSENSFSVECTTSEMADIFNSLNQRNLSKIEFKTDEDDLMAVFINKDKVSCKYENNVATFYLRGIDETEVRITALEDALAELIDMFFAEQETEE